MAIYNIQKVKELISLKFKEGIKIISIDGWTGAGKSTLTDLFQNVNEIEIISFENYFEKNTGKYLDVFNFDDLKNKITAALNSGKNVLVEGICMDEVLQNISIKSDYKIYIKELGAFKDWYYEKYLDESKTTEEIFTEDDKETEVDIFENNDIDKGKKSNEYDELQKQRQGSFYDLVRYHREFRPQDNCDLLFERLE